MSASDLNLYIDQIVLKVHAHMGQYPIKIVNVRNPSEEHLQAVEKWCKQKREEKNKCHSQKS